MALKDLVVDHKKIAEEIVEKIVALYVRYDAEAQDHLTPRAKSLGNDEKVLVFLMGVLGWQ